MQEAENQFDILGGSGGPGTNEPPDNPNNGETTTGTTVPESGQEPGAAEWTKQLSREIRDNEAFSELSGFKSISELAAAYLNKPSGQNIDYDALLKSDKFWETIGVPKADEPYGIGEKFKGLEEVARQSNLTKGQAENIAKYMETALAPGMDAAVKSQLEQIQAGVFEETKKAFPAIAEKLKAEFGQDAALYYNKAAKGILEKLRSSGLGADLQVSRALCALGRETTEGSSGGGGYAETGRGSPKTRAEGAKIL